MDLTSKQKTYFWVIAISVLLLDLVVIFVLWPKRPDISSYKTREKEAVSKPFADVLQLTPQQQDLFDQYLDEYFSSLNSLRQQINEKRGEIINEAFEKNSDKGKIDLLVKEIASLNTEMEGLRFKHLIELKSVLHNQQLKEFRRIAEELLLNEGDSLMVPQNGLHPPEPRKIF